MAFARETEQVVTSESANSILERKVIKPIGEEKSKKDPLGNDIIIDQLVNSQSVRSQRSNAYIEREISRVFQIATSMRYYPQFIKETVVTALILPYSIDGNQVTTSSGYKDSLF